MQRFAANHKVKARAGEPCFSLAGICSMPCGSISRTSSPYTAGCVMVPPWPTPVVPMSVRSGALQKRKPGWLSHLRVDVAIRAFIEISEKTHGYSRAECQTNCAPTRSIAGQFIVSALGLRTAAYRVLLRAECETACGSSRMAVTGGSSRTHGTSVPVRYPAGGGSQGFLPD